MRGRSARCDNACGLGALQCTRAGATPAPSWHLPRTQTSRERTVLHVPLTVHAPLRP